MQRAFRAVGSREGLDPTYTRGFDPPLCAWS